MHLQSESLAAANLHHRFGKLIMKFVNGVSYGQLTAIVGNRGTEGGRSTRMGLGITSRRCRPSSIQPAPCSFKSTTFGGTTWLAAATNWTCTGIGMGIGTAGTSTSTGTGTGNEFGFATAMWENCALESWEPLGLQHTTIDVRFGLPGITFFFHLLSSPSILIVGSSENS